MKNPMQKLRRFFVRSRTFNATAAHSATQVPADDESDSTRLSGAFIVVLVLHVIAVIGVFAFARIKESRGSNTPQANTTQTAAPKNSPAKPAPVKSAAPVGAASITAQNPAVTPRDTPKPAITAQKTHVVKESETLTKIAAAYSVAVPDLVSVNKLKNQDDIHKGQVLTIPTAKTAQKTPATAEVKPTPADPKAAKTYVVRKGESPMKIAREHGCSYEELMKVNNIKDPKKIQVGQVLKLPVKNG